MSDIEEKMERLVELLRDAAVWNGYAPGTLQRRALRELQDYHGELYEQNKRSNAPTASPDEIRSILEKGMAPKEPKPLSLYELIERLEKPVFTKDAAGRKEWKILNEIRIDADGMMFTWSDGGGSFIPADQEQIYFFGEEVD